MGYVARAENIEVPCYADWDITLTWYTTIAETAVVDLTNYTARMKIRRKQSDSGHLASLTNSSGITLGGSAGTIVIKLTDTQTAAITPGPAVYDLEMIDGSGYVRRLIEGSLTFIPSVTRN
tara:strand:- start:53 stop:415 length:363 start_codon:yes stop_codon:yes gene_type:complete